VGFHALVDRRCIAQQQFLVAKEVDVSHVRMCDNAVPLLISLGRPANQGATVEHTVSRSESLSPRC
jgi:hypothetical protein